MVCHVDKGESIGLAEYDTVSLVASLARSTSETSAGEDAVAWQTKFSLIEMTSEGYGVPLIDGRRMPQALVEAEVRLVKVVALVGAVVSRKVAGGGANGISAPSVRFAMGAHS